MLNALTIDVEDYFHVTAFERQAPRHLWDSFPSRVADNTRRLLELLGRRGVRGTFFVLGWVAHRQPRLVREIADAGHEVACHSYWHRLIYRLTPEEFRQDLREARAVIENASSAPLRAYRAPTWSITSQSLWALDVLAEEGFRHDSSIFPIHHDRYGIPSAPRFPYLPNGDGLVEFPPSVLRLARLNVPVAGGGYFRLYPARWTAWCVRRVNAQGQPFMFYLHPWEIDPEQPRFAAGALTRWRHYNHLHSTAQKLDWLLGQASFGPMADVLTRHAPAPSGVAAKAM